LYLPFALSATAVKLPHFLSSAEMDDATAMKVVTVLEDVMKYMKRNMNHFFLNEYEPATQNYLAEAGVQ
jgi:Asp-tRNA(Asn)/Glu-tRNA(Gln) amidotransferase C subunit